MYYYYYYREHGLEVRGGELGSEARTGKNRSDAEKP
jgi:Pyruvate/2-oxoacid:ferredoxin oxidoreductase gamma subunit